MTDLVSPLARATALLATLGAVLVLAVAASTAVGASGTCGRNATPSAPPGYPNGFGVCGSGTRGAGGTSGATICGSAGNPFPHQWGLIRNGSFIGPWSATSSSCPVPTVTAGYLDGRVRNNYPVTGTFGQYIWIW